MFLNNQAKLTDTGILELIDQKSKVNPIVLQITNVEQKAFGFVLKCELADNIRTFQMIIKVNPESQQRIKKFDIIQIRKQNIIRNYIGDNYYLMLEEFVVLGNRPPEHENEKKPHKKPSVLLPQPSQQLPQQSRPSQIIQTQLIRIQQIRDKGQSYNRVRYKWKIVAKIVSKSEIKTSGRGTQWFDCLIQDQYRDRIDLVVFDHVDRFYDKLESNLYYQIQKPVVFQDKFRNKYKIKIGLDTRFRRIDIQFPPPPPRKLQLQNLETPPTIVYPQKQTIDQIGFCSYVEIDKHQTSSSNNKPIVLHIHDNNGKLKKINCWWDHKVSVPEAQTYIYVRNVSHRGDPKAQILHTTRDTRIYSQKQAFELFNLTLNTFTPDDFLFYRKPYLPTMELCTLSKIFKGAPYYYVVVVLIFDKSEIKLKQKCRSCERILELDMGCSCNKPNVQNYYNVRCRISDYSGSLSASVHSSLAGVIARVTKKDSGKVKEEKLKKRFMNLHLKKELVKIQVKHREERSFINIVDVVQRNIGEEIMMIKKRLEMSV